MKPFDLLRSIVLNAKKRIETVVSVEGPTHFFIVAAADFRPVRAIGLLNSCRRVESRGRRQPVVLKRSNSRACPAGSVAV